MKEEQIKPCPQCDGYHSVHSNCSIQEPEKVKIEYSDVEWRISNESGALKEEVNNFVFMNGHPSLTLHEAETVAIKIWELLEGGNSGP